MRRSLRFSAVLLVLVCLVATADPSFAKKKRKKEKPTRTVTGLVWDQMENPIAGAVIQLKNVRTLQVKSFITQEKGSYYFHGLDPNVDYQLTARYEGVRSRTRTLSTFDDRKEVTYNFKLKLEK